MYFTISDKMTWQYIPKKAMYVNMWYDTGQCKAICKLIKYINMCIDTKLLTKNWLQFNVNTNKIIKLHSTIFITVPHYNCIECRIAHFEPCIQITKTNITKAQNHNTGDIIFLTFQNSSILGEAFITYNFKVRFSK